ncbi:MAG: universal stress protein [Frankiales bacterium]|nr:universal stress protein [Frankiales bacterium]
MTTSPSTIVVGIDGSAGSLAAVDWAADEAHLRGSRLQLLYGHSTNWVTLAAQPGMGVDLDAGPLGFPEEARERVVARQPDVEVAVRAVPGDAAYTLVRASHQADLVVVGAHGRSFVGRLLLGSVSQHVVTLAASPTVVVRGTPVEPDAPVAVGIDDSDTARLALQVAFEEARLRGTGLVVFHAWQEPVPSWYGMWAVSPEIEYELRSAADHLVREALVGWSEKYPEVTVEPLVTPQHPAIAAMEVSHRAQLLVLGSHGRGAFAGMTMGSVCASAVHEGGCPVMVVRPDSTQRAAWMATRG